MIIEGPTVRIELSAVTNLYKCAVGTHPKHSYFANIIAKYECFNEKEGVKPRWSARKGGGGFAHVKSVRVRVKTIGMEDTSDEHVYKKELILSFNKLTDKNFETVSQQVKTRFKIKYIDVFITTLWEYFKRQPDFQHVYVKLLESLAVGKDVLKELWTSRWTTYIENDEWKMNYALIEQSHNYDDFCEYLKQKKILNAIAQGWALLISVGFVETLNVFEWCDTLLMHSLELDLSNVVNRSMVDSYIEQLREYSKEIKVVPPPVIVLKVEELKMKEIQKSTKFKIMDFLESIEKGIR